MNWGRAHGPKLNGSLTPGFCVSHGGFYSNSRAGYPCFWCLYPCFPGRYAIVPNSLYGPSKISQR